MSACPSLDSGHALLGVLGAEFRLLATDHAVVRDRGAARVATFLGGDIHHARLCVLEAELALLAAGHAEARPRGTA